MSGSGAGDPLDLLRSTSVPVEALAEALPDSTDPLDAQLLQLFFDRVPMGAAVFDTDKRLVRCNKTWVGFYEHYLGVPADYTAPGTHIHQLIPGNEESVDELFAHAFAGRMVRQAAHRISIPGGDTYWDVVFAPLYSEGRVVGVLDVITDATDRVRALNRLQARVDAFSRMAAGMRLDQSLSVTLAEVAEVVRLTTDAVGCSVVYSEEGSAGSVSSYADSVLGEGYAEALEESWRLRRPLLAPPGGAEVRRIERRALKSDPAFTALRPLLDRAPWESAAVFPLVAAGVLLGELAVHLRPDQMIEDEDFLRALADQTVVAIRNASLLRTVERDATLVERHRLARDLHDSVSQALFSMTLHAAAAQRHLSASGLEQHAAAVEVRRLHDLTRAALAEMRALIFELRPEALKAEGLAQALSRHAAAVAAREGIPVRVSSPSRRLALAPAVEENLYRLALEALNNAIKHAAPDEILIEMEVRPEEGLVITVRDDGCGFDLRADHPGHMGMSTMRDRARAAGGQLEIESAPGAGTAVTVRLPTPR